ncbi:transcription termination factor 2-like isoform X2 [Diabrotica virgifera virgifera]|uniref:Transcription termination factor 2 n=1 Tax=Diabrotica virgifera virgifera TaxID=50390 RepID=A0ABM5KKN7_DIAVI|nr:transcription termination factor 2-like isoform X2 [Diabrotica virgifera virgifera]
MWPQNSFAKMNGISSDSEEESFRGTNKNSLISSDSEEEMFVGTKKNILISSDSEEESFRFRGSKKNNVIDSDSEEESFRRTKKNNVIGSDSEEEISRETEKNNVIIPDSDEEISKEIEKNNLIISDSEEETFRETEENMSLPGIVTKNQTALSSDSEINTCEKDLVNTSRSAKNRTPKNILGKTPTKNNFTSPYLDAVHNEETVKVPTLLEILSISQKISRSPDKTRISQDFKNRQLLCSTFIDVPMFCNTPTNKETGKRLLNRSIDTPRILKQDRKEAVEPRTPKFKDACTSREVTQIILSSSDEESVGVIGGSDDELLPKMKPKVTQIILSSSEHDSDDIIEGSDDESVPKTKMKQPTLLEMFKKEPKLEQKIELKTEPKIEVLSSEFFEVSPRQYQEQRNMVRRLRQDLEQAEQLMEALNMEHLPDKGQSLKDRYRTLKRKLKEEGDTLSKMKIPQEDEKDEVQITNIFVPPKTLSWNDIEKGTGKVQPNTFGKQAMSTYNAQKALTVDRLQQLHGSLKTCPKEDDHADPPRGLTVDLMPHQRRALSWLMWRENQKPSGGILADDMGLGKTLTMISLMLKCNELEKPDFDEENEEEGVEAKKYNGGTLIVCPASLLNQWSRELEVRTTRGLASCEIYHGPRREKKAKRLAKYDMVVTTYSIIKNECRKNGAVFQVKWRRIVIDEAHQIRNHKSQTSDACCRLSAKSRWALTGTPVQNKELDMFALLKFLRCTPFDELPVWKRWVGDKSTGGTERLHTVISSLMLRRTKPELIEKGLLNAMPERKWELISVDLTKRERDVYSKILIFSRTLFAQFLHQRAEKNQDARDYQLDTLEGPNGANKEYFLMREKLLRLNKLKDIKQHEILVLLLRLRQICNHPSLITGMLEEGLELAGDEENAHDREGALDLLDQLNKLNINDTEEPGTSEVADGLSEEATSLKQVVHNVLSPSDPVFSKTRSSSKIDAVIKLLNEKVLENDDKAVIVSQWPSFLNLIAYHLKKLNIKYDQLDGSVPVIKRMDMVNKLNNPKDDLRVMLLSLTAGGVGLNLVGANHLILLDLHWNPQLENQAQDRIYRVGQQKPVFVYKFMAEDTIEKRILDLQEKKLGIANAMLTGTVQAAKNKLSIDDLKLLFEM